MAGGIAFWRSHSPASTVDNYGTLGIAGGKVNRGGRNGKTGGNLRNRRGTTRVQITDFSTILTHKLLNRNL